MEWRIKLEVKTGWGEITQVEIASLSRRTIAATDEDIGLSLAEGKAIVAVLQQAIVTTQIDEYVTCARVCRWMRWSPRGARRVATVRAAMLDNRLPRQVTPQRKGA